MATGPPVRLRPATKADWPLIRRWLGLPEIEDWWGPRSSTEAAVMLALDAPHALCRIIVAHEGGEAVGYGHAVDATLWGHDLPDDLAPGTWEIDLFIASPAHRGTGCGSAALAMLRDEVFQTTLAVSIAVFPSIANERIVRAYEKAGFRWQRVWADPVAGPSWFMTVERPR